MNTPYYAVIFTSIKNEQSIGYQEMAQQMWDISTGATWVPWSGIGKK